MWVYRWVGKSKEGEENLFSEKEREKERRRERVERKRMSDET